MPHFSAFQEPLAAMVEQVQQVDIRAYEVRPALTIVGELRPQASSLVSSALGLVGEVLDACAEDPGPGAHDQGVGFEKAIDQAMSAGSPALVGDIAFMAHLELRQRQARIGSLGERQSAFAVLSECDSALRRIRKAMGAIDTAIATTEHTPVRIDFRSELALSLEVRRAYAKFRRRVAQADASSGPDLYAKLRAAGTCLAVLVGRSIYPELRIADRIQLRGLQERILAWLRPEHRLDRQAGLRLWQDFQGFVDMLPLVNRRQELLEHDRALLGELRAALGGLPGNLAPPEPLGAALRRLEGLDPQLDALLLARAPAGAELLRERVAQLAEALLPGAGGGSHGPW